MQGAACFPRKPHESLQLWNRSNITTTPVLCNWPTISRHISSNKGEEKAKFQHSALAACGSLAF